MSNEHDDDDDIEHVDVCELPSMDQLKDTVLQGVPPNTLDTWRILMCEYLNANDADRPMLWRNLLNHITTREFH